MRLHPGPLALKDAHEVLIIEAVGFGGNARHVGGKMKQRRQGIGGDETRRDRDFNRGPILVPAGADVAPLAKSAPRLSQHFIKSIHDATTRRTQGVESGFN